MPGPIPKRSDQRRRRNKPPGPDLVKPQGGVSVRVPRVSSSWHPLMKDWFRSLKDSGQAAFYEPSDWQTARLLAEVLSQELNRGEPLRAAMLAEFNRAAASLMTTEGERRRLRIELQREMETDVEVDATVSMMDRYREKLTG